MENEPADEARQAMSEQVPTGVELERLYEAPKIVDGRALSWEWDNDSGAYRLEAPVLCPAEGVELTLRGVRRKRFSFSLWYKRTILIRRWDYKHFREGGKLRYGVGHKHPEPGRASAKTRYAVSDIPTDDPDEALMAFLRECRITVEGPQQITKLL